MTAADRIRERAAAQAAAEATAKALVKGKSELVARLLKLRFGGLSSSVTERLQSASPEQLDAWAERVLTAPSLQAVFE